MIFSALFTLAAIIITVMIFIFPSKTTPTGRFGLYDTFAMWVFTYLMIRWTIKRAFDWDLYAPSYITLFVISITTIIGICSGIELQYKKVLGMELPSGMTYDINGRVALAFFLIHAGFAWPGLRDLIKLIRTRDNVYKSIKNGELPNSKEDLVGYMNDGLITQKQGQKILNEQKKAAAAADDSDSSQKGGTQALIDFALKNGNDIFYQLGGDDKAEKAEYTMPGEDEVDLVEEASTKKAINDMIANNPYINARTTVDMPLIAGWLLYVIIQPLLGTPTTGPFVNMWNSYVTMFKNLKKPTNLWGYLCQFKWPALIYTLFTLLVKILTMIPLIWILKTIAIIVLVLAIFFFVVEPVWSKIVYPLLKKLFSSIFSMVNVSFLGTGGMMGGLSNSLL